MTDPVVKLVDPRQWMPFLSSATDPSRGGCLRWHGPVRTVRHGKTADTSAFPYITMDSERRYMRSVIAQYYGRLKQGDNAKIHMKCGVDVCLNVDHMLITRVSVFKKPERMLSKKRPRDDNEEESTVSVYSVLDESSCTSFSCDPSTPSTPSTPRSSADDMDDSILLFPPMKRQRCIDDSDADKD